MNEENGLWFVGTQAKIHLAQADNADRISIVEHRMAGGFGPPLHVHRGEDEIFHILDGRFLFERGDERVEAGAGETLHVPAGTRHGFRVLSANGGRMLTVTRGGFEGAIRAVSTPALFDGVPEPGQQNPAAQAELGRRFADHGIDLLGPPIA